MATQLKNTICGNLLRIRTTNRYSQQEIADVLAVKQPSYQGMEAGRTQINAVQLGTLAKFYCMSIHYFYENDHGLKGVRTLEREGWLADQLLRHNELLDKYRSRIEDLEVMVSMRNGNANEEQCVNQITPFFAKHVL